MTLDLSTQLAQLAGSRVQHFAAIVDDLLATGGTALAATELLRLAGAEVRRAAFVIDLPDLGGSAKLASQAVDVRTLMGFEGD